jgi:hypothetical protein
MDTARQRLQEADGLAAVLDAAYAAFKGMLSVIHSAQDPASGLFAALVVAAVSAASAADGRDALALAPSLPRHPLLARTTEIVYRRELRPVITTGAEIMDQLFTAT